MASLLAFWGCLTILVITIASPATAAEEFKVGDAEGWHQPGLNETQMYNHWTSGKKIHVGDSVRFEYKNDSVVVVDKWGYYHCDTSSPTLVFNNGNTTITLDKPGPIYFISGDPDHCEDGQRLLIDVIPLHRRRPILQSPPVISSPPRPYFASSPAPSPFSSSGASVSVAMVSVMVAVFATMACTIGL